LKALQGGEPVPVSLLWIIIIVLLVLAVLGYFGRGRF
jgi:flagellar basal body-associated protein FliL